METRKDGTELKAVTKRSVFGMQRGGVWEFEREEHTRRCSAVPRTQGELAL